MSKQLYGDRPISDPGDDEFGMSSFADALATSLLQMSPKDGLVVSVEGPWGTGKSSALALAIRTIKTRILIGLGESQEEISKLTETEIDEKWLSKANGRTTHIVRFNPWYFSGQENLVRAFFTELAGQIEYEPGGVLKKAMNRMAAYLPSVAGGLAGAGMLATGSVPAAGAAAAVGRAVGEAAERALKSDSSLEDARKGLTEALKQAGHRIIVVVDDIDRLLPSEMRSVFSLVKSLGDLPNVLYVLAFDEAVVMKGLSESVDKADLTFLEKIVQVSLKLPPPWRNELRQMLYKRLNAIIAEATPADEERWNRMMIGVIDPYLETPRDVMRLANTLQVIWPNVKGDVDLADLVAITTLQLFDPEVYRLIRNEIERLTYAEYRYEDDKDFAERLSPNIARQPHVAKEALELLFPRLSKIWNKVTDTSDYYIIQKQQRRISTKEYYRNYFVFGRDPRMISSYDVDAIVLSTDPGPILSSTLSRLAKDPIDKMPSRVATLLEQIAASVYSNSLLNINLLRAILICSDELIRREDEIIEMFVTNNINRIETIVRFGCEKLNEQIRGEMLDVLVSFPGALQIRAFIVEGDARRSGYFNGSEKQTSEPIFPPSKIQAAALTIRSQIEAVCKDGTIWDAPMPIKLICSWKRMDGGKLFKDWIESVVADDELIVRLAHELPARSYRSDRRHGLRILYSFKKEDWISVLDVNELFRRLEALSVTSDKAAAELTRLRAAEAVYFDK